MSSGWSTLFWVSSRLRRRSNGPPTPEKPSIQGANKKSPFQPLKTKRIEFDNGITSENPRNYQDANIYRFGLQYRYSDKWTLRGGIYFDESPVPDGYFAPETPRNDSIGYTAGATYHYSKNLELDFSLLILTFEETDNSYDYYEEGGFTIPFGGTYDSAANSIGFGLSYKY